MKKRKFLAFLCPIIGHKKVQFFAAPNIYWECSRCGFSHFVEKSEGEKK